MCCWNTPVTPQCNHSVSLGATVTEGEQEVSQSPAIPNDSSTTLLIR